MRTIRDAATTRLPEFSWATVLDEGLPPTPTQPAYLPAEPPASIVVPTEIAASLQAAVTAPTVRLVEPDNDLRVMKRKGKDADVYLFFDKGAAPLEDSITFLAIILTGVLFRRRLGRVKCDTAIAGLFAGKLYSATFV